MEDKNAQAREQAQAQLESIKAMVAALTCDYGRLEELRDERAALEAASQAAANVYDENTDPGQVEELKRELMEAEAALLDWLAENAEELEDLAAAAGNCESVDDARLQIEEDALCVEVRSGWHVPGAEELTAEEFRILLCTGGPAVQIIGDLDRGQPERPRLMYQDWFTSWEELVTTGEDNEALLRYCECFYFEV